MIISFLGLSGAGKTYYSTNFFADHKYKLIKIHNRFEKYFFLFIFFFTHPIFSISLLRIMVFENKGNKKLLIYKIKHLFFLVLAREGKSLFFKNPIIDDGIFQFLLSIFERKISDNDLIFFKKVLKRRKIIIYMLEASREMRLNRMKKRKRFPRMHSFGEKYFYHWLDIGEYNYVVIKDFIIRNFDYKIIENN